MNEFLLIKMPTNVGITMFSAILFSLIFYIYKLSQLIFYYSLPYLLQFHRLLELLVSVHLSRFYNNRGIQLFINNLIIKSKVSS